MWGVVLFYYNFTKNMGVGRMQEKKENTMARALRVVAILELTGGIIGWLSFINSYVGWIILSAGIITSVVFYGFAEVITLLQRNADTQDEILRRIKKVSADAILTSEPKKSTLQDIESNLPKM